MKLRCKSVTMCLLAGWMMLSGCGDDMVSPERNGEQAEPVVRTADQGAVRLAVTVNRPEITLAERLKLTIEVTAAEGVDVELPRFVEHMGHLAIHDTYLHPVELLDGERRWRQEYELEAFVSGTHTTPNITVVFTDRRASANSVVEGRVSTDGIAVTVNSLFEGELDQTHFCGIKGPVALPAERPSAWVWWTGGGLAVVVALLAWASRRRERETPEPIVPPHEWARDRLQALLNEGFVERGFVQQFYYELSMIVRQYIERRYSLSAPERTTEEFVAEMKRDALLPAEYQGLLGGFLAKCDIVKFARHAPPAEEIREAFNTARDFVDQSGQG